jgi:hypothetical protein
VSVFLAYSQWIFKLFVCNWLETYVEMFSETPGGNKSESLHEGWYDALFNTVWFYEKWELDILPTE